MNLTLMIINRIVLCRMNSVSKFMLAILSMTSVLYCTKLFNKKKTKTKTLLRSACMHTVWY